MRTCLAPGSPLCTESEEMAARAGRDLILRGDGSLVYVDDPRAGEGGTG